MSYEYTILTGYAEEEINEVIDESITSRLEFAQRRLATYQASCAAFEQQHNMSTQEFLDKFESGALGDQQEWFDWYAAAEGKTLWSRKYDILAHLV